jgi:anti-sigma regulatory factor (Ser/Thr protein kinase)
MDNNLHVSYSMEDKSYIGILKREIRQLGQEMGMADEEIAKCQIIVSEMATNLIKYADKGREILLKIINEGGQVGFEFISIDSAPGIADARKMLRDSISTSGTLGQGLGAIQRLSNYFEIYSQPGTGTIVLSRVYKKKGTENRKGAFLDVGGILLAMPGQVYCGDDWACFYRNKSFFALVFDGLGHGIHAHEASSKAIEVFKSCRGLNSPADILKSIHTKLKKTRGGVGSIVMIDNYLKTFSFCGVGNVACRTITHYENKSYISFNGIIGLNMSRINDRTGPWSSSNIFVLHSDGVKENWDLSKYPGLQSYDPTTIAAVIYRDFTRHRDDVSIIVGKNIK